MKRAFYLYILILLSSCTEPYQLMTTTFDEAIVIEATLTNELKTQQIKLSKTYRLEENGPSFIENASIFIEDDLGNTYNFHEGEDIYESDNPFQAMDGRKYRLFVNTPDGKSYKSEFEKLTSVNPIQSVEVTDKIIYGERGAEIKVKAFDPTNSSKYYRYEYEETYKIIAPYWLNYVVTINPDTKAIINTPRTYEARTCYSTNNSNDILLHNTSNLQEDRVDYMIRFISIKDPIIKHRYSINVKQYVQNLEAHTYYRTLKSIASGSGSILSQIQPGFFSGNIICETDPNEKVIGFFDVSTVSTQRMFFNFTDVFPNTIPPKYFYDCFDECMQLEIDQCPGAYYFCYSNSPFADCDGDTIEALLNSYSMLYKYETSYNGKSLFFLTVPPCGDCTTFSSNVVPPFWQ